MKKIPTIFKRNICNMKQILHDQNEDCAWVFAEEGLATRKYDGTCCMVNGGDLFKRREIKKGKKRPDEFLFADYDEVTQKTVGWVSVSDSQEDRWHVDGFGGGSYKDGTYELCGPKIQGNPEGYKHHILISHADSENYPSVVRTFDGIREFLLNKDIEGLVFHHKDGRMAKIKKRDYGLKR